MCSVLKIQINFLVMAKCHVLKQYLLMRLQLRENPLITKWSSIPR